MLQACGSSACRVVMVSRATAPIDGSASPRKPSVRIASRSSPSSFEVAWRSTASARSARVMPSPSSVTRISRRPPPSVSTSMRRAPASSAFSTSSLTTLAGRSTTSPAAMRLTMASDSWRTGIFAGRLIRIRADFTGALRRPARQRRELPPLSQGLIPAWLAAAQAFDAGAVLFALEPLPPLGLRHFGRPARHRPAPQPAGSGRTAARAHRRGCAPASGAAAR